MVQGYDAGTRLLFKPDGEIFPAIPDNPTKDDALAALKVLEESIDTFPFKTAVDRSVAISLLLTALCRRALDHAPLHAITAARRIRDVVDLGPRHAAVARSRRFMPVDGSVTRERSLTGGAHCSGDRLARRPRYRL
jgi:hypothetical protein